MSKVEKSDTAPHEISVADLPHRKAEHYAAVYANTAGIGATFFDMQLLFGRIAQAHKDEVAPIGLCIEDSVSVSMCWEHAKALTTSLTKAIEDYEKTSGPIRAVPAKG